LSVPDLVNKINNNKTLVVLLIIACLKGLFFVLFVPPWQHYDEPTHFEYARIIAEREFIPSSTYIDRDINIEVADSMFRYKFWDNEVYLDILGFNAPHIGLNEKVHPFLYYSIAAIPIKIFIDYPIEIQLYMARLVSVFFSVLVVLCSWKVTHILYPDNKLLAFICPLIIIHFTAFIELMSSVNNDVLVNFLLSLVVLSSVSLIKNGFNYISFFLLVLSLILSLFTKRTAVFSVVPLVLTGYWIFIRREKTFKHYLTLFICAFIFMILGTIDLPNIHKGVYFHEWLIRFDDKYTRLGLETIEERILNNSGINITNYINVLNVLFVSFWAKFGWGQISLDTWLVSFFVLIAVFSVFIVLYNMLVKRYQIEIYQMRVYIFMFVFIISSIFAALIRYDGISSYLPQGRYIYAAIIPITWLMIYGMASVFRNKLPLLIFMLLFSIVDLLSIIKMFDYYYL
jgi:hypothetical protein